MMIKVLLFGEMSRVTGKDSIEIEFKGSLRLLKEKLSSLFPEIRDLLNLALFAVDMEYKTLDFELKGEETVAVIPPVSGG